MIARRWPRHAFADATDTTVVASADDPSIVWAARHAPHVTWVAAGQVWTADSAVCLDCGSCCSETIRPGAARTAVSRDPLPRGPLNGSMTTVSSTDRTISASTYP